MTTKLTPIPLYQKVRERLITQIDDGVWRAGAALPNEFKLADELGVSQGTVRKALIELEKSGIVQRVQGKGTFVTTNTPERALFHFFRLADKDGDRVIPTTKILDIARREATDKERKKLGLNDEQVNVIEIKRLRYIETAPTLIEIIVLPEGLFKGIDKKADFPDALYPFYQSMYHQSILTAEENIAAISANDEQSELLGVKVGTPLLAVERTAKDLKQRALEFRTSLFLTQNHTYQVELK